MQEEIVPVVDLTQENTGFTEAQTQHPPEVFYAAVDPDYEPQIVSPPNISAADLAVPPRHYPIHVSVTIPQCPFLRSCEISPNISPGPAPEILVPPPSPPQSILSLPPPTTIASQCSNYSTALPQHHHATLPPPPAHISNFTFPHHLGKSSFQTFDYAVFSMD